MWIILLDHSGSMGEPFSGAQDLHSRRTRKTESDVKLDAAREVLLTEIARLDAAFPLLIFGFTAKAQLLYQGEAGRHLDIEAALNVLTPDNGTDIAAALDAAADYTPATPYTTIPRILLISDGKSDRVQAKRAARHCVFERSMGIHFILIDPTEDGEAFVREVVEPIGSTWDVVTKREGLSQAARGATEQYRQDLARAEAWAARADQEAAEIEQASIDRETVEFTAGYPGRIRPDTDYPLLVFAHLASMKEQVEGRLADLRSSFGQVPRESQAEATQRIPIGTIIEITPAISNISATPLRQTLAWMGELEEVTFRLRHRARPEQFTPSSGFVDITASGLLIARIPIAIAIDTQPTEFRMSQSTAEMIRRVFASYSRKDEAVVRACKAAYRALAVQLFVDKDDILTGQQWRSVIRQRIADHQLFQLYWSKSSADSSEVANEWQIALEIAPQRAVDFIQPVFWSRPMITPPTQLAHLNFGFLDLAAFDVAPAPAATAPSTQSVLSDDLQRTFPIFRVTTESKADTDRLRHDLARIVPWLEDLISVRYYPPATFLVDEHAVRTVKALLVPQESPRPKEGNGIALENAIELLKSLALAFHVGSLLGDEAGSHAERNVFFGAVDEQSKADYEHVVRMAEGRFSSAIREFIKGKDVFGSARESFEQCLRKMASGGGSGWHIYDLIEHLLALASASDRTEIEHVVSTNDGGALRSFDEKRSAALAAKLLGTRLPQLAARYGIERFFGYPDRTELRLAASFPVYVRSFCDQWLGFVDVALQRRGNQLIKIGYQAPEDALRWLERELPNLRIMRHPRESSYGRNGRLYDLSLGDYRASVAFLSGVLVRELQSIPEPILRFAFAMRNTFGVYIPGNSVRGQQQVEDTFTRAGWPAEAGISGQDKVLVCLSALQRLRTEIHEAGTEQVAADNLAYQFAASVLVHEHFHSAMANGLDSHGRASLGSATAAAWAAATRLNESLAVWTERHFFRDDSEMARRIEAYIQLGQYPDWPYAGAGFIESQYTQGGVPSVRRWIHYLRDDPENAQAEFDRRRAEFADVKLSAKA